MDPLFCRDVGSGHPIVVVHGGPDFDHAYLLPELDRLAASFRLVYYDQRGRGRSAEGVRPEDVTLASELDDLERVRSHFELESLAVLGHSWGGVLAMEYAIRHPDRVSQLLLLDTGPASADDWRSFREELARRRPADVDAMRAIASTDAYARGDLEAEAAYYRIHFRITVRQPDQLEMLVARLRSHFTRRGRASSRGRSSTGSTRRPPGQMDWDLFPALRRLDVPTLVLHGEDDFVPVEFAVRIAEAVPGARLSVLPGCGHFTFLEAPELVFEEIDVFCGAG